MEKQWIENLRKRFADRQQPAPDGLWNGIETAMTEQRNAGTDANGSTRRKRNRTALTLKICATAAAACALWLTGLFITNKTVIKTSTSHTNDISNTTQIIQKNIISTKTNVRTIQQVTHTVLHHSESHMSFAIATQNGRKQEELTINEQRTPNVGSPVTDKETEKQTSITKGQEQNKKESTNLNKTGNSYNDNQLMAYSTKKGRRNGVSFGIHGSNMMYANKDFGGGNSTETYADAMSQTQFGNAVLSAIAAENGKVSTSAIDNYVKVKHRQPIKFGVTVRFNLTNRLALGTGLNYSYLSSDISVGSDYSGSETEQKLHYVGVPLNLTYDVWRSGNLNVYMTGGGAVDICVGGTSRTWHKTDNTVVNTTEENMREHRPQLSVNAAAGVEYNINKHIGIYAEPGVGYYFNNHSDVTTVYKDKPLCFNLSVGLRFTVK